MVRNYLTCVYYITSMPYSLQKIKFFVMLVCIAAFSSASVFAYDGNVNIYGQLGVHKTQSAQTIGHGGFGIGLFMEGAGLSSMIKNERLYCQNNEVCSDGEIGINSYIGGNLYPYLALGLSDFFDFAFSLPIYGDYLRVDGYSADDNLSSGGWGNLLFSSKLRAPFDNYPIDLALLFSLSIATGKENTNNINSYGPWVRDPIYLNLGSRPLIAEDGLASSYTNASNIMRLGAAGTLDFNRMSAELPLMVHLNYTYRTALGQDGKNFPNVQSLSVAIEWTPVEYISLFGEFYNDMPTKWPENGSSTDFQTLTFGTSFHLSSTIDLQLGMQMLIGESNKYIDNLSMNLGDGNIATYSAGLVPKYTAYGGLTVKLFKQEEEIEYEEEEYRNPDTDGDGVCDPWVAESGRQKEFSRICTGIDLCPYEVGPLENNGCPMKKKVFRNPDTDGDGVCDPWVTEEGREEEFEEVCVGIDLCPYEAGSPENNGCPIIEAKSAAPTIIFSANPESIQLGQTVTLSWITTDADEIDIDGLGPVQPKGTRRVKPEETTSYTITATGKGGTQTETIEIIVETAIVPTVMFSASPETVQKGQSITLTWMTTDATDVSIDGIGIVPSKGTRKVSPSETTTYTIIAKGEGGTQAIETVEVTVEEPIIEAKVNLKGVNFLSGKSELTLDAKRVLDGVAEQLLAAPNVKIEIHGHTDNVGKPASNQELSERRAKSVVGYLATKGVKMSRMKAIGFGQDIPIAENTTAVGREQNRRIEMIRVDD